MNSYDDCIVGEHTQIVEKKEVEICTMDEVISSEKLLYPDFLSIDAESMSYEILEGARQTLKQAVAVICETEYVEFRTGQKTFFDIGNFLKSDFYFAGFLGDTYNYSPFRAPLGFRGRGIPFIADALFLKKKEKCIDSHSLAKLAFLAFAYGFIEYGFHTAQTIESSVLQARQAEYMIFIKLLLNELDSAEPVYKPTFTDINPTAEDAGRRYFRTTAIVNKSYLEKKGSMERRTSALKFGGLSDLEYIFLRYGLVDAAKIIREKNLEMHYTR
jgi:hypothetical protein